MTAAFPDTFRPVPLVDRTWPWVGLPALVGLLVGAGLMLAFATIKQPNAHQTAPFILGCCLVMMSALAGCCSSVASAVYTIRDQQAQQQQWVQAIREAQCSEEVLVRQLAREGRVSTKGRAIAEVLEKDHAGWATRATAQ